MDLSRYLNAPDLIGFVAGVAALFLGHLLRAIRWRLVLRHGNIHATNFKPLAALSLGYVFNAVLPFRLGEIVRAAALSYMARADFLYIFATIVVERALDLVVVLILFVVIFGTDAMRPAEMLWPMLGVVGLFAAAGVLLVSQIARRLIWSIAAIFNETVKTSILHFAWSLLEIAIRNPTLRQAPFWLLTAAMWAAYAASLALVAPVLGVDFKDMFSRVYSGGLLPAVGEAPSFSETEASFIFGAYLFTPLFVIAAYFLAFRLRSASRIGQLVRWVTDPTRYVRPHAEKTLPKFAQLEEYSAFLDRKFRGRAGLLTAFETHAIAGAIVHRMFHGGSAAVTALVEQDGVLRVRKFSAGDSASKLEVQRKWLLDHAGALPLVSVGASVQIADGCYYDMQYAGTSRDFYEAIHTEPLEWSKAVLGDIITRMSAFHQATNASPASDSVIADYATKKVCDNLKAIEREAPEIFALSAVKVNGREINMADLSRFRSPDWLAQRLKTRSQSFVHGDLTVENILLRLDENRRIEWFLIDPNPVNGFESPYIDFAKLLQSLHLGYESLNRDARATLVDDAIQVNMHRSHQYKELMDFLHGELSAKFGESGLQEIYLHEMVNYFRLIPYQFRRSRTRGLAFLGALFLLVADYDARYPGDLVC